MNLFQAIDSLAALAQETRLNIFRLLVRHAPLGLPAGEIARRLRLPGPTLSFHLNVLAAAALIEPHKRGRSIRYSPCLVAVTALAAYLVENCCAGSGRNVDQAAPCEGPCPPARRARRTKESKGRRGT